MYAFLLCLLLAVLQLGRGSVLEDRCAVGSSCQRRATSISWAFAGLPLGKCRPVTAGVLTAVGLEGRRMRVRLSSTRGAGALPPPRRACRRTLALGFREFDQYVLLPHGDAPRATIRFYTSVD